MNDLKLDNTKDRLQITLKSMDCHMLDNAFLFNADCFDILKQLPDNSIDSFVTDGPYGIGFTGKEWDNFKPKAIKRATKAR